MQGNGAPFGRRPVVTQLQYQRTSQTARPSTVICWLLLCAALPAAALLLYPHRTPSTRTLSPVDAAAIERVIAGQDISISALDGIPNVSVDYYDVDATNSAAIRRELNAKGPIDRNGQHFDAHTHWDYRWNWGSTPDGSCGVANADVSFSAIIRLPHLTHFAALKPEVAQAWRSYMSALAFHEAGHVRNGYGGRDTVANAVRSSSCADANAAGDNAVAHLGEEDERYDDRTDHGANDGATFG